MTTTSTTPDAVPGELAGRPVTLHFGDVSAEYDTLRHGALVVDRSWRERLSLRGPKAAETLTGLVTNDVQALAPGHGLYAAALTPKGKVVADLRVFAFPDDRLLVDCSPRAAEGWMGIVRKYVNPRLASYRDETAALRVVGIFGPRSRELLGEATAHGAAHFGTLLPYHHHEVTIDEVVVTVARVPDLGVEGFDLFVPAEGVEAVWRRLLKAGALHGAKPGGVAACEIARVEAGRPEWGLDVDENTIAQEANLDELHAISYTKGCYTGQEVVARVHFRGHVNKLLRGLRFTAPAPAPSRAQLYDAEGRLVGDVRSTAASPRLGPIGLAMLRREVQPGAVVTARWEGGETPASVVALPFAG